MKDESHRVTTNRLDSLLQPDTLMAFEYFDDLGRNRLIKPERKLMLAVLENALVCFQRHVLAIEGPKRQLFREAETWIWENNEDWPFSFLNITEEVGLDPRWIRIKLLHWKQVKIAQRDWVYAIERAKAPRTRRAFGGAQVVIS